MEQVVEIVGNATRQAADRLHLLNLDQHRLGPFALRDLLHQAVVGTRELAGALHDPHLQLAVEAFQFDSGPADFFQVAAGSILSAPCADRGIGRAGKSLGIERTLQQDHVAQAVQRADGQRGTRPRIARREHDERKVRPRRLHREPVCEVAHKRSLGQRLLGHNRRGGAFVHAAEQVFRVAADLPHVLGFDHALHHRGVAPVRRMNQDAQLHQDAPARLVSGPATPVDVRSCSRTAGSWGGCLMRKSRLIKHATANHRAAM